MCAHSESPIDNVFSIKECMRVFDLKDVKTVRLAIISGRVKGRKLDSAEGAYGGTYIIDCASAFAAWGYRIKKDEASNV